MAFTNKIKKKRILKFYPNKNLSLIDPVRLFLQTKNVDRLNMTFLKQLNSFRMLKIAFSAITNKCLRKRRLLKNKFSILDFLSRLEMRVDSTLCNTGLMTSRFSVKQLVHKRKILINGSKIKSQSIKIGARDIITIDKSVWIPLKRQVYKKMHMFLQPCYFEINYNIFTLIVLQETLNHESIIFLSNKYSRINFRVLDN